MALGGGTDVSPTLYAAEMKKQVSKAAAAAEFEGGSIAEMAFQIDDLLDFSNEDIAGPIGMQLSDDTGDSSLSTIETVSCTSSGTGTGDRCRYPNVLDEDTRKGSDDLCVPCDDLEELEWLSNFVHEEPFVALSASCETFRSVGTGTGTGSAFGCHSQSNNKHEKAVEASSSKEQFRSGSPNSVLESSASSGRATSEYPELAVRGRPRTKRSRAGPRVWTSTILSSSSSADTLESYSHNKSNKRCEVAKGSSRSPARALSPVLSGDTDVFSSDQEEEEEEEDEGDVDGEESLSVRKQTQTYKKCGGSKKGQDVMQPRRCMHCQTQRTPQWRTGPMGPKTLCNACGVRYKSGRLLPEYRPAGSPGYVNEKHSNSHKKILEMRRQKELSELAQQQQQQQQQQHSSMSYLQEADYRVRV